MKEPDEHVWADRLAKNVATRITNNERTALTWFNHHSVQKSKDAGIHIRDFGLIGLDGSFLRTLVDAEAPRTSADLFLPLLLPRLEGAAVAVVGGSEDASKSAAGEIERLLGRGSRVVFRHSGFGGIPNAGDIHAAAGRVDLLIAGMGAPMQDSYVAAMINDALGPTVATTCGGWLDQVSVPSYYPAWAYRFGLNWLVRLWREPRRLWKRYTVDATTAWLRRHELRAWINSAPGFHEHSKATSID